jgi:hypothetical protein
MGASAGSLNVTGESTLHGAVTAGALAVTGASILRLGVTAGSLNVTGESTLHGAVTAGGLTVTGASILHIGLTAGSLNVTGGVSFTSTENATNGTSGGALTILGGAAIAKSLYANTVNITPNLGDISAERSFTAANNVTASSNITDFSFNNSIVRSFNALTSVIVERSTGGNLYANYEIKGLQKNGGWIINTAYIGDETGLGFTITSAGQIQYTSTNQANWSATTIKFRALTTNV